ncbi:MAG: carbonic anhydrase [Myxococcota bacterium]
MSDLEELLERNRATQRHHEVLPILPRRSLIVVSCLDARTDPTHFLGLAPGEALVLRNVGARVTPEIALQIAFIAAISRKNGGPPPTLMLVHHTNCGAESLARAEVREAMAGSVGVAAEGLEAFAIGDHDASLREDLGRLQASPYALGGVTVNGLRLDHTTGGLDLRFTEVLA